MKPVFVCLCLAALLTACAAPLAPAEPLPAQSTTPALPETGPADPAAPPALQASYQDPQGRFALAYPAGWQLLEGESGSRGGYVQLASWDPSAAGFESLPAGESLLQIAEYQWDPKGDLTARVAQRQTALTSSGNTVLEEETVSFSTGPDAVRWLIQDSVGNKSLVYFFVLGDNYLELTGIGDLALLDQIIQTFAYLD